MVSSALYLLRESTYPSQSGRLSMRVSVMCHARRHDADSQRAIEKQLSGVILNVQRQHIRCGHRLAVVVELQRLGEVDQP